jgi:hypothetical protein
MKRVLALIILAGVLLAGCRATAPVQQDVQLNRQEEQKGTPLTYSVQYIRTNGYHDGAKFPGVALIKSLEDLQNYYTDHRDIYDLERKEKVYTDTTAGFLDACDRYDEAFFEEQFLLLVLLEEGSGSVSHEVCRVERTPDKKISVSVDSIVPEVGTSDMAQWHVILELSRNAMVDSPGEVLVYWNGNLRWNGSVVAPPKPEAAFKEPPDGTIRTPDGDVTMKPAGYGWFYEKTDGTTEAVIADQAERPLPKGSLEPVIIGMEHAETIYLPVPGSGVYEPTDALGYLIKFQWEVNPSSVTCTCWPDTVWQDGSAQGEKIPVDLNGGPFYAKVGGYIYEFAVTWEDTGTGYYGTANYYVYIIGDALHSHQSAFQTQTADNSVTGCSADAQTTLYIPGSGEYTFTGENSAALTELLASLDYNADKVCRCMPQYRADTQLGSNYHIHLEYGFVRCDKGQAELTQEQIDKLSEIILWAKTAGCE